MIFNTWPAFIDFTFSKIIFSGSLPEEMTGLTSSVTNCSFRRSVINVGTGTFSSVNGFSCESISKPSGANFVKKSFSWQPPNRVAIANEVLPTISFLKTGLRSFSNRGLILIIASSASGLLFKIEAIFVFALIVISS